MHFDDASDRPNKRAKLDTQDIADRVRFFLQSRGLTLTSFSSVKPPTDFFGRLVSIPSADSINTRGHKNVGMKFKVSYKFLEGNSAAVRRPVKVNTFL